MLDITFPTTLAQTIPFIKFFFAKIFGIFLMFFGAWLICMYWHHYIECLLIRYGFFKKEMKTGSFAPLVAPISIIVGTLVYGEPLAGSPIFWVFLIDSNTYIIILSIFYPIIQLFKSNKNP